MELSATTELIGTIFLAAAIVHTFSVSYFQRLAARLPEGSAGENLFHLLGEVEVVFGLWAGLFVAYLAFVSGLQGSAAFLESLHYTEPAFVFVVMTVCSTQPILNFAERVIEGLARVLPLKRPVALYGVTLVVGPLLGSLITEPAAMTVTALLLLRRFYDRGLSTRLMYATLGLLFVNISIGGTLTHFAAPPVLMVAGKWDWGLEYMLSHFGWKAALACVLSTAGTIAVFYKELAALPAETAAAKVRLPAWVTILHLLFLVLIVISAHHMVLFLGFFLFFLGLADVTKEYQTELKLKEGLLVGFFLAGVVTLGPMQKWWLQPLLAQMDSIALYMGAMGLTAITDNAALTYLGSQVELSDPAKYALVAGSVVGGGLTVIANAPNPAGYGILNRSFGEAGISPIQLFIGALPPTLVAALCFWFL